MQSVLQWLVENATLLSSVASLAMLAVWLFYAILFYREFRRQRRPLIVIHQAHGYNLDSMCLVTNLSREPIHILCVMLILDTARGSFAQRIRSFRHVQPTPEATSDIQSVIKQGPLLSGSFLVLGSFAELIEEALDGTSSESSRSGSTDKLNLHEFATLLTHVEIRVIALHSAHEAPVGASRRFTVAYREDITIYPAMLLTEQLSSRSQRHRVKQWLLECLPYP